MTVFGLILATLIFIGIFALMFINVYDGMWFVTGLFTFVVTSGAMLILALFIGYFSSIDAKYEKDSSFGITYINSLSVNSNITGSFCLGSGRIDTKDYYYYVSNSEFGYQISKIENDGNIYVKEDCDKGKDNKPFIEYTKYKAVHINWFGKLLFKNSFFLKDGEIIIHVPKNTVIKDYNVDISKL